MTELKDVVLVCQDCKREFTWIAKEQAVYKANNFDPPKYCRACRMARRKVLLGGD